MNLTTRATKRLGIRHPIVQGPFGGGYSSVALAAAVSNAGGLGSFGAHALEPESLGKLVVDLRSATREPFAINLWVPLAGERDPVDGDLVRRAMDRLAALREKFGLAAPVLPKRFAPLFEEQIEVLLDARPPVMSFVFGAPPPAVLEAARARGITTIGAATTVNEARLLEAKGLDLVVASGSDAGGHRPSFLRPAEESLVGTFSLVPQVVAAVKIPVIAAGGIADGRGIAAALVLGAEAAQLGTRFLACDESAAPEVHKDALVSDRGRTTELTRVFSGRYARGIVNERLREGRSLESEIAPYPVQNWLTQPIRRAAAADGDVENLALWAGQSASLSVREPAAVAFAKLLEELDAFEALGLISAQRSGNRSVRPLG